MKNIIKFINNKKNTVNSKKKSTTQVQSFLKMTYKKKKQWHHLSRYVRKEPILMAIQVVVDLVVRLFGCTSFQSYWCHYFQLKTLTVK